MAAVAVAAQADLAKDEADAKDIPDVFTMKTPEPRPELEEARQSSGYKVE